MHNTAEVGQKQAPHDVADLDLDASDSAVATFKDLLKTRERETWVFDSPARSHMFANVAIGQIKWPKALGRPGGPRLSAGFVFVASFWDEIYLVDPDGNVLIDVKDWVPGLAPSAWDAADEADHYSVIYMVDTVTHKDMRVEVNFSNVHWTHHAHSVHGQSRRYLSSRGWQYNSAGGFMSLPDITVDSQPFFHA